jgi:hypothetical protein
MFRNVDFRQQIFFEAHGRSHMSAAVQECTPKVRHASRMIFAPQPVNIRRNTGAAPVRPRK